MVLVSWVASSSRNCFVKPPSSSYVKRNPMEEHLPRTCWRHWMVLGFAQEAASHHRLITYLLWTHQDIPDLGHVCPWCPFPACFTSLSFPGGGLGTATLAGCFHRKLLGEGCWWHLGSRPCLLGLLRVRGALSGTSCALQPRAVGGADGSGVIAAALR